MLTAALPLCLLGDTTLVQHSWIQVSGSGPNRINTYNGGGQFEASVYLNKTDTKPYRKLNVTCVDFLNVFATRDRWQVHFTKIDGSQSLAHTRYGGAVNGGGDAADFDHFNNPSTGLSAMQRYRAAAWLTTKLVDHRGSSTQRKAIQGAIWYLLDPKNTPNAPKDGGSYWTSHQGNWLTQATSTGLAQANAFYQRFRIVSQVNLAHLGNGYSTRYQEFITTVTPEPAQFLPALFLLAGLVYYFRRNRQDETRETAAGA